MLLLSGSAHHPLFILLRLQTKATYMDCLQLSAMLLLVLLLVLLAIASISVVLMVGSMMVHRYSRFLRAG